MESNALILTVTATSIVALLFLIVKLKFQPFLALILVSLGAGLAIGMAPQDLLAFIVKSMGGTLGFVALIIGLGSMFGEMLRVSGGSERLALTLIDKCGDRSVPWALGLVGFLVSIAVFIDVAIVILVPLIYGIARRTGKSLLYYGIPLCAGLSVTHTFLPPTPGPIATASILGADLGWVIIWGVIAGLPAMAVAGPMFGKFISSRIFVPVPEYMVTGESKFDDPSKLPAFKGVVLTLLLPLVLILGNTSAEMLLSEGNPLRDILMFIGNPIIALLLTTLLTFWIFGHNRGFTADQLQKIATKALEPAGIIILITGAGGVFGKVLVESGVGKILADAMQDMNMPLVLFGFATAAIMRISQGSGTVAMITGASLTAPVAQLLGASPQMLALCTIAIACGGAAFSHVNDSGFWMANRYFGMSVSDTLKSWTVMKTIVGLTGLAICLVISLFIT
ncbi:MULTISPECIES: gluconate:H+ symporter [Pseudomonadaceae]|uniref:GntT/GntP/DsdX family permease n=1 Tax=Pseudomonadaceae TaxID=135621 RepID=UPI0015E38186|nr:MULTISPECIES: gluconate:H+ symporter [Pseudomonadaceae]MBA1279249.1 gluconate transporter [Stutzerimonas stutzeri]MBC8649235.1 gluconate transporter [Pseudomonas sp. MT4]QXY90591.1 gluconate transporter [Pseudomonas sp. MTM4]